MNWLRNFFAQLAWCIGFPMALLIIATFPIWFTALWAFCIVMAYLHGDTNATR
jgi:hypothetical protein